VPARPPNIFFIVLDDYGGRRAMKDLLGFDNEPFLDALRARGFTVPAQPSANYARSSMSLASSLNLDYLQDLLQLPPDEQDTAAPLEGLIQHAAAPSFLQAHGYRYIHIGSWWGATSRVAEADENVVLQGTVQEVAARLHVALPEPGPDEPLGKYLWDRREWLRIQFQFEQVAKLAGDGGPDFVFAHILSPHLPSIFDPEGKFRGPAEATKRGPAGAYTDDLQAVNAKTLALIDTLHAVPYSRRPVIILQSDEGYNVGTRDAHGDSPDAVLEQHFGILEAYDLPGLASTGVYPTFTPVNLFRLLFDDYFAAGLAPLPDRNYVFPDFQHLYAFQDVTDRVQRLR
jgi:hypothetical protein